MCTLWTLLQNLSILDAPFPVLLSTLIRSRFQAKPAILLIPIGFSIPFRGGGALRYSVPKWLLFLISCGSGFHCLRNFFFFLFSFSLSLPLPLSWVWVAPFTGGEQTKRDKNKITQATCNCHGCIAASVWGTLTWVLLCEEVGSPRSSHTVKVTKLYGNISYYINTARSFTLPGESSLTHNCEKH